MFCWVTTPWLRWCVRLSGKASWKALVHDYDVSDWLLCCVSQESQSTVVHNPPDGVKVRCACVLSIWKAACYPAAPLSGLSDFTLASLISVSLSLHPSALQGSTESNATNDEEEMKGRKGTQVFHPLFFLFLSALTFSVSHLEKCAFFDCSDWQVCWDTTHVCHALDPCACCVCVCMYFNVCLAAFCVCVF